MCVHAQSCPTIWDPMVWNPPGSSVHEFFKQEYWSGLPFPSPGGLPDPGIKPGSPALQGDAFPSEPPGKPFSYIVFKGSRDWGLISLRSTCLQPTTSTSIGFLRETCSLLELWLGSQGNGPRVLDDPRWLYPKGELAGILLA